MWATAWHEVRSGAGAVGHGDAAFPDDPAAPAARAAFGVTAGFATDFVTGS
jgi:hypothetical protein